jgi:hypothetical protein
MREVIVLAMFVTSAMSKLANTYELCVVSDDED